MNSPLPDRGPIGVRKSIGSSKGTGGNIGELSSQVKRKGQGTEGTDQTGTFSFPARGSLNFVRSQGHRGVRGKTIGDRVAPQSTQPQSPEIGGNKGRGGGGKMPFPYLQKGSKKVRKERDASTGGEELV